MNFVLIYPKLEFQGNNYLRLEYQKPRRRGRMGILHSKILIIHTIKDPTVPKIKIIDKNKKLRAVAERNRLKNNGELLSDANNNGKFSVKDATTITGTRKSRQKASFYASSLDNNHTIYGCGNIDIDKLTSYEEFEQAFTFEDDYYINDALMNDLPVAKYSDGKIHTGTPFKDIYGYYYYKLRKEKKNDGTR